MCYRALPNSSFCFSSVFEYRGSSSLQLKFYHVAKFYIPAQVQVFLLGACYKRVCLIHLLNLMTLSARFHVIICSFFIRLAFEIARMGFECQGN